METATIGKISIHVYLLQQCNNYTCILIVTMQ